MLIGIQLLETLLILTSTLLGGVFACLIISFSDTGNEISGRKAAGKGNGIKKIVLRRKGSPKEMGARGRST